MLQMNKKAFVMEFTGTTIFWIVFALIVLLFIAYVTGVFGSESSSGLDRLFDFFGR